MTGSVKNAYINAVLDHNSLGGLCDFAVLIPCHLFTGKTAESHGSELAGDRRADIFRAHVSCDACCFASLSDRIDAVISVCCELVRDLAAALLFVSSYEVCCQFIRRVRGERSEQENAFCQRGIKSFQSEDSVHTVNAEEGGSIAHLVGLCQDQGCGIIVDRKENDVRAGILSLSELNGEVLCVGIIESAFADYDETDLGCFIYECIADTL